MPENTVPAKQDADPRLDALHRLQILDTDYEPPFDRIVRMVADFFDMPSVGIHLLDNDRQWVKAFEGQRFTCPREDSVCQFTLAHDDLLVIPDLRTDARTRHLGIVTGPPHVRFYAGMPLRTREGHAVGTLCLIASEPRARLDADEERWLREYAELVIETMELRVDYHRSQQELRTAIEFDAVTGLRNRASIIREAQALIDTTPAPAGVAAVKVRLDRMELVLGATGQSGIGTVLRTASERLARILGPDDMLARGDGDTFIIVRVRHMQHDDPQLEHWLEATAEQALTVLAEPMAIDGDRINITASIGLAAFADGVPAHYAIDAASAASLASADNGGNRAQHFAPDAFGEFRERVGVEADLREAVTRGAFTVSWQPIVEMAANARVIGAEALVRWPRGDKHAVGPDRFIPIAEETGLIHKLGLWVFEAACSDLAAWRRQGHDLWISVNLSPLQLDDPQLTEQLKQRTQAAGVDPSRIKLEITESALSTHINEVDYALQRLREAGFQLALDDFGTGHSSLARLIRMPFNTLKVDRGFVNDCPDGPGAAVVTSVSALAHDLGIELVAEGVEHDGHERFLREHGYTLAQGYYYARPMSAEALIEHMGATA
ncbi:putative bifunctional diguanylate cyclase/phosphodiesterase [Halofilum ochraceum]|uniref:putative bifunctional diguanylate cyclase/phosphodiesterase n=1 Tax=Halofilum ochraceum TaxID=1611323 RepID=UPI0008DA1A15|nr:EAL domain-containing protein [Halofilum ochraceum]